MTRKKFNVLMSVYRGGKYIAPQLESLVAQIGVNIQLTYHMDEEDPAVEAMIQEKFTTAERIAASAGQGLPGAYFALIDGASDSADFWAFSDQDDIWHPDKLLAAATTLASHGDTPCLWVCGYKPFVDSGVGRDGLRVESEIVSLGHALVQGVGPGCAMVWNRPLQDLLQRSGLPQGALMHDSWTYLVASAFGRVIIEPRILIDYRLHEGNAIGMTDDLRSRLRRFSRAFRKGSQPTIGSQANAFLSSFESELDKGQRELVSSVALNARLAMFKFWITRRLYRASCRENLFLGPRLLLSPKTRTIDSAKN